MVFALRSLFLTLVLLSATASKAADDLNVRDIKATTTIIIPQPYPSKINQQDHYYIKLLRLALDKTSAEGGDYRLKEHPIWLYDNRLKAMLLRDELDVIWSDSTPLDQDIFLPVRISLFQELSDYRLLIIRSEDQKKFSAVMTLDDLRELRGGMSPQWYDAQIMRENGLPMVLSSQYESLFKMLAAKRFEYFSRGLYQVKSEADYHKGLGLVIEKDLMLYYPSPIYFFVNKNRPELAERLTRGLSLALKDGSFDALLNTIPSHRWGRELLQNHHRRILDLKSSSRPRPSRPTHENLPLNKPIPAV